ncbi:MAG TPA: CHRD domain-containing protein [Usitatibacter sp.]|nr:CHRD domain-containing protein [Usitatibacter sp.]
MKALSRTLVALACTAALGACSTMDHMMHSSGSQHVSLTGASEVPAVDTGASGSGTVTVNPDHTVKADIMVTGMEATAAHIHEGAAGKNGKVIIPLTKEGDDHFVSPPGAKLTDEQYEAYKRGDLYVNAHSKQHPGGEIRAQLSGS